jgi:hypothetical protein
MGGFLFFFFNFVKVEEVFGKEKKAKENKKTKKQQNCLLIWSKWFWKKNGQLSHDVLYTVSQQYSPTSHVSSKPGHVFSPSQPFLPV